MDWNFKNLAELHDKFGWEEYLVLAITLLISALIGIYWAWKGQNSTSEFLMASKQMTLFPTTMSLACSFISAITILGTPAETYVYGTQYWMIGLSYPFVVAATAHVYLPVYFKLQAKSVHYYLELRFNRAVRIFASVCFIMLTCLYLAIVVYAPALALAQVTGMDMNLSIGLTFLVCIFYTALGGIKAVIWTNVFQALCMITSCLVVVILGEEASGGSAKVFELSYKSKRIELFNFDPSILVRHTFWSQVVGGYFTWMTIYGINQTMVQRYLTVKTQAIAQKAIWLSGIAITIILSLVAYAGLVIYAYYEECDPINSGLVSTKDQLLPLFVMDLLSVYPGFPGFFVAGVFSGALSTVSGGLNSLAAVTLEDFVKVFYKSDLDDVKATRLSKLLAIFYGIFSYGLIVMVKNIPGLVQAWLGIFGVLGGPVLGLFSLGMFMPFANSAGALTGGISSVVLMLWISIGGNFSRLSGQTVYETKIVSTDGCPDDWNITISDNSPKVMEGLDWWYHLDIYDISYMWYSGVACMIVVIVGSLVSLLNYKNIQPVDPDLLASGVESFFCCWPKRVKKFISKKKLFASHKYTIIPLQNTNSELVQQ